MKLFKKLIFIMILASASGYAFSTTLETRDVESFNTIWAEGLAQGNTEGLMGLYMENAVMFPPSSQILKGRTEIRDYFDALREAGFKAYTISNVDADIKDDTIYETALWEASRLDTEGNVVILEGNITNVYEKQNDGSWKIKFQSWN